MATTRTPETVKAGKKVRDLAVKSGQSKKVKGGPNGNPWRRNLDGTTSKST